VTIVFSQAQNKHNFSPVLAIHSVWCTKHQETSLHDEIIRCTTCYIYIYIYIYIISAQLYNMQYNQHDQNI